MKQLEQKHIEIISDRINNSKITSEDLKTDLIDHFCCAIEDNLNKGKSFEMAYDNAFNNICPNGFQDIEGETIFLLSSKKNKRMNQIINISASLSIIGITATILMKTLHMPYSQIVLLTTDAIMILLFLPTLFIRKYKNLFQKNKGNKTMYISIYIALVLIILTSTSYISHFPGLVFSSILCFGVINLVLFPLVFFTKAEFKFKMQFFN